MLKSILFESLSGADVPQRERDCFDVGILCSDVTVKDGLFAVSGVNQGTSGTHSVNKYVCPYIYTHKLKKLGLIVRKKNIKNQIHWSVVAVDCLLFLRHFFCLFFSSEYLIISYEDFICLLMQL